MRWEIIGLSCSAWLLHGSLASAQEDPLALQVHGFVSQGYIKTTKNNYLGPTERAQGSFEFTEVGLNVTKPVSDKLRIGVQLFAHDLGPLGNYVPQFDWYYLDYRFFDWLGLRAGKTKLPWGLYNESNDVDAGRVPVLLPQSVYPVTSRESLFAQTGGEAYGDVPIGSAGTLEYRAYAGTIFVNTADSSAQLKDFQVPYVLGGRLMWRTPLDGLQLGGSFQAMRFEFEFTPTPEQVMGYQMAGQLPADFMGNITAKLPFRLWVASAEYQWERVLVAAEYSQIWAHYETNLLLPQTEIENRGGYLMFSYQVAPWFTPGVYYSASFPAFNAKRPEGTDQHPPSSYQHDVAVTLRYDITPNWLVKLEGHYMHGTAALTSAINGNKPLDSLDEDWGALLLKTTGYF